MMGGARRRDSWESGLDGLWTCSLAGCYRALSEIAATQENAMKAIVFPQHGGPDVLRHTDIADTQPGPAEVLVRVRACALNHLDLWVRRGMPAVQFTLPIVPGSDIAGEVAAVG